MAEAITSTILQNVRVLAIGHSVQPNQVVDLKAPKVPVATLIVTPEQAEKLELAKNQGRISLSLRNPLDVTAAVDGRPVSTDVLDPSMRGKMAVAQEIRELHERPRIVAMPPEKPKPLAPPPARAVVDVFRGDKHVQEVFRD
jgi:pilus assembly protein CpaB